VAIDNDVPDTKEYRFNNMPATIGMINPFIPSEKFLWSYYIPNALTDEQIESFSSLSESGAEVNIRYMTGGIIRDYNRLEPRISNVHDWGYNYISRFIIEGTFNGYNNSSIDTFASTLYFTDIKNLAGYNQAEDGETISILAGTSAIPNTTFDDGMYVIRIIFSSSDNMEDVYTNTFTNAANSVLLFGNSPYDKSFVKNLNVGSRYLVIGNYIPNTFDIEHYELKTEEVKWGFLLNNHEWRSTVRKASDDEIIDFEEYLSDLIAVPIEEVARRRFESLAYDEFMRFINGEKPMRLGDMETYEYVPSIFELGENYHETEEYLRALEIADITNQDLHTFDIVYTQNMRSIPRFNEGAMVISEGRMLSAEDETSCVVSQYFLDIHNLKIGDKLTIELGDRLFEQNAQKGAITYIPERRWSPIKTTKLEIVGAYLDIDPGYERNATHYWGYSPNTIFVPLSLLPITLPANHEIKPGEFSLLVENVRDIPAFLKVAEPLAAEMGLNLRFSDGGWSSTREHLETSLRTSFITTSMYVLGAILAFILATYLFIGRNKKTYAILRALGITRINSNRSLFLPFGALSVLAVPIGGIIGLIYTTQAISREYITDTSLPVGAIILCFALELAFIALITALFLHKLAKKLPLELLQGDIIQVADVVKVEALVGHTSTPTLVKQEAIQFTPIAFGDLPKKGKYSAFCQVAVYIFKHISRVKWKTAISLILATTLTGAIGVLTLTIYSYQELFNTVSVTSTVIGFDSLAIDELSQSEIVKNLYFFSDFEVSLNLREYNNSLTVTNDIERYLKGDYTIEYAEGFSSELFQKNDALCIIGSEVATTLEVKTGDEIIITKADLLQTLNELYFGNENIQNMYRQTWESENLTNEEFEKRFEQEVNKLLTQESISYKIAGVIHSENSVISNAVFTPSGEAAVKLHSLFGDDFFIMEYSQFTLADNEKTDILSSYLNELKGESRESAYFIDTVELDNIRRVRDLLVLLFPIALAGAVLIGLTAPGLIIIQSAKEAAILRVLGVTKKRVRCMLCFEQISLCICGIMLAAGGLVLYNSGVFTKSAETLVICGVLYLLGCICAAFAASVSVTKRRIIELLQVKE
jgi:hypothetical protein